MDDDDNNICTSLVHRSSCINHAELPITASAASSRTGQLLICDGRYIRLFSGTEQVRQVPLPLMVIKQLLNGNAKLVPTSRRFASQSTTSAVHQLHYNESENNFVLVYAAKAVRFVAADLTVHDSFDTGQTTIIASAWIECRQELVTTGTDGSIQFFATRKHYRVLSSGRQLIPSFVKRMSINTEWRSAKLDRSPSLRLASPRLASSRLASLH